MLKTALFLVFALTLLFSCQTVDSNIPEGSTPELYFQRAQSANDNSDYETALKIYQKFLDTKPQDRFYRLSAQYEIALIHFKLKALPQSKQEFLEIIAEYKDAGGSANLPAWIKILTDKKLAQLTDVKTPSELQAEADRVSAEKAAQDAASKAKDQAPAVKAP